MSPLIWYLASLFVKLYALVARPSSAACVPPGWLATGVQADGSYVCYFDTETEQWPAIDAPHDAAVSGRVWCTSGATPLQVGDGRRVRCTRGSR